MIIITTIIIITPECSDSLAYDGVLKIVLFLPSRTCFLKEGSKRSSVISGTNAFFLILNKGFLPVVFSFSNVQANPGQKFWKMERWKAPHFSGQPCHIALMMSEKI